MAYPRRKEPQFMFLLLVLIILVISILLLSIGDVMGILNLKKYKKRSDSEKLIKFNATSTQNINTLDYIYTEEKVYVEQMQEQINNLSKIDQTDPEAMYMYEYGIDTSDNYTPPSQYGLSVHPSLVRYTLFDPLDTTVNTSTTYINDLDINVVNNSNGSLTNAIAFIRMSGNIYYVKNVDLLYLQPYIPNASSTRMYIQFNYLANMSLLDSNFSIYKSLLLTSRPSLIVYKDSDLSKGYTLYQYPTFDITDTYISSIIPTSQTPNPNKTIAFITIKLKAGDKVIIPPSISRYNKPKYAYSVYPSSSVSLSDSGKIYSNPTATVYLDQKYYYVYVATQDSIFEWGIVLDFTQNIV